jgi:hypothetical protein
MSNNSTSLIGRYALDGRKVSNKEYYNISTSSAVNDNAFNIAHYSRSNFILQYNGPCVPSKLCDSENVIDVPLMGNMEEITRELNGQPRILNTELSNILVSLSGIVSWFVFTVYMFGTHDDTTNSGDNDIMAISNTTFIAPNNTMNNTTNTHQSKNHYISFMLCYTIFTIYFVVTAIDHASNLVTFRAALLWCKVHTIVTALTLLSISMIVIFLEVDNITVCLLGIFPLVVIIIYVMYETILSARSERISQLMLMLINLYMFVFSCIFANMYYSIAMFIHTVGYMTFTYKIPELYINVGNTINNDESDLVNVRTEHFSKYIHSTMMYHMSTIAASLFVGYGVFVRQ